MNAHFLQPLLAQTTSNAQGSGEPTGEVTATGGILETAVLDVGGVVGVTGTGTVL